MFIEIPNFLSQEEVDYISDNLRSYAEKNPTERAVSRYGKSLFLSKLVHEGDPLITEIDQRLYQHFARIAKEVVIPNFQPDFPIGDSGYEYHWYRPGENCVLHSDGETAFERDDNSQQIIGNVSRLRFATVLLYLKTCTDGGEIVFPKQRKIFKAEAGKLLAFPPYNYYEHYTNPSSQDREIIMTWMNYDNIICNLI